MNFFNTFDNGVVTGSDQTIRTADLAWNDHPDFAGVSLKHLLTGAQTDGRFSAHLVRLAPGAEIAEHIHEASWELHEVASGSGVCLLEGRSIDYEPGVAAVMPEKAPHRVMAGEYGLCLLAKFVPALL